MEHNEKLRFPLASGGIIVRAKFSSLRLGNAHGQNNLLSFLALRIREIQLIFAPKQSDGMEIIMMKTQTDLWNEFEKTGTIESYLKYKENGLKNKTNETDEKETEQWELSKQKVL